MPGITPVVNDLLQVRVTCRVREQISQNVLHYKVTGTAGGGLTLQQLANGLNANFSPAYRPWMPIVAFFEGVTVQNVTPPRTNPVEDNIASAAGTSAGDLAPRQASGLISTKTDFGGRENHGRIYIGFISGSYIDPDGSLNGAGSATLLGVATALGPIVVVNVGGVSDTLQLTVRHPDVGAPPAPSSTDVVTMKPSGKIATQRRRGDYGRAN